MAASLNSPSPVAFSSSHSSSSRSRSHSQPPAMQRLGFCSSPEFRGLRTESASLKFAIRSRNGSVSRRCSGGKVVSEAQQTAVDIPAVTDATWQELVVKAKGPVLVEVWAPWCGPCRMIHPVIEELSEEYAGKLKFYRLNTDESPSIASKYSIRTIPTMVIFNNGEKKDYVIGAVPKSTLTTMIKKFV